MQGVSRAQDLIHTRIDLYLRVTGVLRGIAGSTEEMVAGRRSRTTRILDLRVPSIISILPRWFDLVLSLLYHNV